MQFLINTFNFYENNPNSRFLENNTIGKYSSNNTKNNYLNIANLKLMKDISFNKNYKRNTY